MGSPPIESSRVNIPIFLSTYLPWVLNQPVRLLHLTFVLIHSTAGAARHSHIIEVTINAASLTAYKIILRLHLAVDLLGFNHTRSVLLGYSDLHADIYLFRTNLAPTSCPCLHQGSEYPRNVVVPPGTTTSLAPPASALLRGPLVAFPSDTITYLPLPLLPS